jgi:hypothetical protein
MLSIQEMVDKTIPQRKNIKKNMEKTNSYHSSMGNLFTDQKRSIRKDIAEALSKISLREFLLRSGTTGIAGANYLIPDKLNSILISAAQDFDIAPLISMQVISGWEGGDLDVDIVKHDSLRAEQSAMGGEIPAGTADTVQATISPRLLGQNIAVTNELIEDAQWDLVEWHVAQAGKSMGYRSTEMIIPVLTTSADGDGTHNSGTSGDADETKLTQGTTTDIVTACRKVGDDEFVANTLLCTSEAWGHSISVHAAPSGWATLPAPAGFDYRIGTLDVKICNSPQLHASTDALGAAFTNCISVIFDRRNALLTGRKRWLQIENYSDPVQDLAGAVVSSRQDSISVYDDSIYVLTET